MQKRWNVILFIEIHYMTRCLWTSAHHALPQTVAKSKKQTIIGCLCIFVGVMKTNLNSTNMF